MCVTVICFMFFFLELFYSFCTQFYIYIYKRIAMVDINLIMTMPLYLISIIIVAKLVQYIDTYLIQPTKIMVEKEI